MQTIEFNAVIGDDGVIRPPRGTVLPHGAVQVVVRTQQPGPVQNGNDLTFGWLIPLAQAAEERELELPMDLAMQHDHYAHGKPKP
jgi:hypothetical protein